MGQIKIKRVFIFLDGRIFNMIRLYVLILFKSDTNVTIQIAILAIFSLNKFISYVQYEN